MLKLVGVSYTNVHGMMKRGEFPRGYKAGCRTMWRYDEVIEWIKSRPHAP
jgi:predicted DNA-binding transcriptional regulator AlpA